ncbi:HTH domain-containing protein [Natronococcus jeotgali]|uniref:Uncharacterized protein n=1 Tax=Natronococcus jeotgali DSM 18795 TaxID=1227498 RepID=L9XIX3_9EURY|nr:HTH domain-containing protein [Natronococcus jeotgali]ELY61665.1 hypothetical protein C492_09195 [Natronococcus jeotgali DSM 18795]
MPVSSGADFPTNTIDRAENIQVDCYVRSDVPAPVAETINALTKRLQQLCDHGPISDFQVSQWPPEHHGVTKTDEMRPTRDELVAEFEQWAEQHDYTLEPAFRRNEIPSSPLGLESNETHERVRVPFVAIALYEADTENGPDTEALRGVVPYTEGSDTVEDRTYTVQEWLSTLEAKECEKSPDSQYDQAAALEGAP